MKHTLVNEKLPNTVIHACKNITKQMNLLKMCGPQIRLCLFTVRPICITLKGNYVYSRQWAILCRLYGLLTLSLFAASSDMDVY